MRYPGTRPTVLIAALIVVVSLAFSSATQAAATATWTATGPMPNPRSSATSTLLPDGRVLVAGGLNTRNQPQATAYLYNPVTQRWRATGSMLAARAVHAAVLLQNGTVLVAGGMTADASGSQTATSTAEVYNPATATWTTVASMGSRRAEFTATVLRDGHVLVAGGMNSATTLSGVNLASAEIFDPTANTWTQTGTMQQGRADHTATLLNGGNVLVSGGYRGSKFDPMPGHPSDNMAAATLYDTATGTWVTTGDLVIQRFFHTATLLSDGTVLVAGGYPTNVQLGSTPPTADSEIYHPSVTDPSTGAMGTWMQTGLMHKARADHSAVLLASGRVLVAGGVDASSTAIASAEVYNPATGVWRSAGAMLTARSGFSAALLSAQPCGSVCNEVLVAGGGNGLEEVSTAVTANAELFTP